MCLVRTRREENTWTWRQNEHEHNRISHLWFIYNSHFKSPYDYGPNRMGNILSSALLSANSPVDLISSSLTANQLIHQQSLSTCYDPVFDISLSSENPSILVSDGGRLRYFQINFDGDRKLFEKNLSWKNLSIKEQIHDLAWSTFLNQYLVLTSKSLTRFDHEKGLINFDLQLEKGSPPLWRIACWSSHLIVNLGLGESIRYYELNLSSLVHRHSWSRAQLNYKPSESLKSLSLSSHLTIAINVELENNKHVVDLYSLVNGKELMRLRRFHSTEPCALDVITQLPNYTWLCKSHWPSDDCLCLIESDGEVKKISTEEQAGYILNMKLTGDRTHFILVRTASKLAKEKGENQSDIIEENEVQSGLNRHNRRELVGKLPANLVLEIYRIPSIFR